MIYLAPLQGFTDYIYRKVYADIFTGIDAFFIPYVAVQNNQVLNKYKREILPHNNLYGRSIPQILVRDAAETKFLVSMLKDYSYTEVNLNLGCPYPMVTNRGRGAALLAEPDKLKLILDAFFNHFELKLSVKMRAGLHDPEELHKVITVLNEYPVSEIIFHARIAKQLYKGEIISTAFQAAMQLSEHPVVYNGDIFSIQDFEHRSGQFTEINNWMLGRGVLMNALLPAQIKGMQFSEADKRQKLLEFHEGIIEAYLQNTDNEGNAVNKQKQFWIYFSHHFENQARIFKRIKKSRTITDIRREGLLAIHDLVLK